MNRIELPLICFLFGILSFTAFNNHAIAQSLQTETSSFEFNVWGGYSFNSVKLIGKTPDSQSSILAIGIKKKIKNYANGNLLYYTADIIPHVEYHYPKRDENNKRTTRSGWGVSPVGFQLQKSVDQIFHPFLQISGGILYMNQTFPTNKSRRLNFTGDLTIGSDIVLFGRKTLTLGYKFHHISNAQTGNENPGLDSNFLFISLLF